MKFRLALPVSLAVCIGLWAHPMGNFSVSHFSAITVEASKVRIDYVLDIAEIPAGELFRKWGVDGTSARPLLQQKAETEMRGWGDGLQLNQAGKRLALVYEKSELVMNDGAGGLPVMRITGHFSAEAVPGRVDFVDANYADRAGWKEIVIRGGDGVMLAKASQKNNSISQQLMVYPTDPAFVQPQDVRAFAEWQLAAPSAAISPAEVTPIDQPQGSNVQRGNGEVTRGDYLSTLLGEKDLSWSMIWTGLAVAFVFGGLHALEPGHGKTVVAAYLVGTRGTVKHALFLGFMVTFTHTVSVFLLGAGTLFLSSYVVPGKIIPILSIISGLSIVLIGGYLLIQRMNELRYNYRSDYGHEHSHDDGSGTDHNHGHSHGAGGHSHVIEGEITLGSLIGLAVTGGMVPCPSALVLLLGAVSMGRIAFGLALLTSFSLGLAGVLMAIGLAVLFAKNLLPEGTVNKQNAFFRYVPVLSALLIFCVGLLMTGVAAGLIKPIAGIG